VTSGKARLHSERLTRYELMRWSCSDLVQTGGQQQTPEQLLQRVEVGHSGIRRDQQMAVPLVFGALPIGLKVVHEHEPRGVPAAGCVEAERVLRVAGQFQQGV